MAPTPPHSPFTRPYQVKFRQQATCGRGLPVGMSGRHRKDADSMSTSERHAEMYVPCVCGKCVCVFGLVRILLCLFVCLCVRRTVPWGCLFAVFSAPSCGREGMAALCVLYSHTVHNTAPAHGAVTAGPACPHSDFLRVCWSVRLLFVLLSALFAHFRTLFPVRQFAHPRTHDRNAAAKRSDVE